MGVHVIFGDMRDRLGEIPDASVDAIIADPPYGETSLHWDKRVAGWPALVLPKLKPSGSMWVFGSLRLFMETADQFGGWKMSQDVIWEKHNGSGAFNDRFRRVHEIAAHFYPAHQPWSNIYRKPQVTNDATARTVRRKNKPQQWGSIGPSSYQSHDGGPRLMRSVLQVRSEHGRAVHPTQKPLLLLEPLLAYCCPEGGTVLDPFAGSGSTGLAASQSGRHAILIEHNADFVSIAEGRVRDDAPLLQARP